jgi:hypothetical protein
VISRVARPPTPEFRNCDRSADGPLSATRDEPKPDIHPLTRSEAAHLVAIARERFPRWHPWVLLALRTGLRVGEQIALQRRRTGSVGSSMSSAISGEAC